MNTQLQIEGLSNVNSYANQYMTFLRLFYAEDLNVSG
jgi:hypothetical protein